MYFNSLPHDAVSAIVSTLCEQTSEDCYPLDLFQCGGMLEESLYPTFAEINVYVFNPNECDYSSEYDMIVKDYDEDEDDNEVETKTRVNLVVWRRCFVGKSPTLNNYCHQLRSLILDMSDSQLTDYTPFDSLFKVCGASLKSLKAYLTNFCIPITKCIERHCRALDTLIVNEPKEHSLLPMFQAIGEKLQRLSIQFYSDKDIRAISECLPHLTDLQICAEYCMQFFTTLKSTSLQLLRFDPHRYNPLPSLDIFTSLFERYPSVLLSIPIHMTNSEWKSVLQLLCKSIEVLYIDEVFADYTNIDNVTYTNLKELRLGTASLEAMGTFFSTSMPKLEKLVIEQLDWNANCASIFETLSKRRFSALQQFECWAERGDGDKLYWNDQDIVQFLTANQKLKRLIIKIDNRARNDKFPLACWETHAIFIIESMKICASLIELDIHVPYAIDSTRSKLIADACVCYRGRGVTITVDGVRYVSCPSSNMVNPTLSFPYD